MGPSERLACWILSRLLSLYYDRAKLVGPCDVYANAMVAATHETRCRAALVPEAS